MPRADIRSADGTSPASLAPARDRWTGVRYRPRPPRHKTRSHRRPRTHPYRAQRGRARRRARTAVAPSRSAMDVPPPRTHLCAMASVSCRAAGTELLLTFAWDRDLTAAIRALPGRRWSRQEQAWAVPDDPPTRRRLLEIFGRALSLPPRPEAPDPLRRLEEELALRAYSPRTRSHARPGCALASPPRPGSAQTTALRPRAKPIAPAAATAPIREVLWHTISPVPMRVLRASDYPVTPSSSPRTRGLVCGPSAACPGKPFSYAMASRVPAISPCPEIFLTNSAMAPPHRLPSRRA